MDIVYKNLYKPVGSVTFGKRIKHFMEPVTVLSKSKVKNDLLRFCQKKINFFNKLNYLNNYMQYENKLFILK